MIGNISAIRMARMGAEHGKYGTSGGRCGILWTMISLFRKPQKTQEGSAGQFGYLPEGTLYLDSACQTLRPQCVIDAETEYYRSYNACGGRVKYPWGVQVDSEVREARRSLVRFCGKSESEYDVVFTLNTTYGINLVLHQLPAGDFDGIVTSEIEHNSVFLPTITWSQRHGKERRVLPRMPDGGLQYEKKDVQRAVVLVNTTSNIDGRSLQNAAKLARDVQASGGIMLCDAAQTFGHDPSLLRDVDFDAAFGSGHKMYGPSMGFVIIKKSLLSRLVPYLIGGGTVQDVTRDGFTLVQSGDEAYARLEPGLQNWGGIIGLKAAVEWLDADATGAERERALGVRLVDGLRSLPRVRLLNHAPGSIVSFSVDKLDAHQLALILGEQGIMCRSGYFCCHYYLDHLQKLPPQLRVSLGRNNSAEDVDRFLSVLQAIFQTL